MNKIYRFYDTDYYGNEEYDITGEEYKQLIQTCCEHSEKMSFKYFSNKPTDLYQKLKKFKICSDIFTHKGYNDIVSHEEVVYYRVCSELCYILQQEANGIFEWLYGRNYKNPEDPCFYRKDGTFFLATSIHNGEITIFGKDNEIDDIVKNPLWINSIDDKNHHKYKVLNFEKGSYSKPAKEISEEIMSNFVTKREIHSFVLFSEETFENDRENLFEYHCFLNRISLAVVTIKVGSNSTVVTFENVR